MNQSHLEYLVSEDWKNRLLTGLVPWIARIAILGDDLLEIGPGPGLTTDILRGMARHITAVEIDRSLAAPLADRLAGTNVDVVVGSAEHMPFEKDRFSAATAFTMLHHVPTAAQQDAIFTEVNRVLRPGCSFLATDTRDLDIVRAGHADDIFVPLPPETLRRRLECAGFVDIEIEMTELDIRFVARKPG